MKTKSKKKSKTKPKAKPKTKSKTKTTAKKTSAKKTTRKKTTRKKTSAKQVLLSNKACEEIFAALKQARPQPKGELAYTNPYTLLVAVVLSAQATDVGVNRATKTLFPQIDTPEKMVKLGEAGLKEKIRTIGLYRTKAKNVIALSQQLIEKHGSQVPQDHDSLVALPGVGRKTANVVRNIAFGAETIAVDTHVFRVANRTGLASGTTPEAVEAQLLERVPGAYLRHAHHWLILHGRYTCTARAPKCATCPIFAPCGWNEKANYN